MKKTNATSVRKRTPVINAPTKTVFFKIPVKNARGRRSKSIPATIGEYSDYFHFADRQLQAALDRYFKRNLKKETEETMIRNFFIRIEDWVMDDESLIISFGKFVLVVVIPATLVIASVAYIASTRPNFSLPKADWSCTQSHEEYQWVPAGKTETRELVNVCDEYRRR